MTNKNKKWIQHSIKHKGALRRWAEQHRFLNKNGTIDLSKAYKYAKTHKDTHRLHQINLAKTLRKIRKK